MARTSGSGSSGGDGPPPAPAPPAEGWPVVGREDALRVAVSGVVDGGGVVVTGSAGVGRTRLAREVAERARHRGREVAWASVSTAASAVPLGALAHLLPAGPAAEPSTAVREATAALAARGRGGVPPVLVVDDAHLLDPLAATLLHHLVAARAATPVLTVRSGAADPFAGLWKDGTLERVELRDLSRPQVDELLAAVLPGWLDSRAAHDLWRLSGGNPLYLRELVAGGRASGRLRSRAGLWTWDGPVAPSARLVEIVLGQLDGLAGAERRALEITAVAGPTAVAELLAAAGTDAVGALERAGLLAVDEAGLPRRVRVRCPLHAHVVARRTSAAPAAGLPSRPAGAGTARPEDEAEPDPVALGAAAEEAAAAGDDVRAERLARAATARGGPLRTHVTLVGAVRRQGRVAESGELAAAAAERDGPVGDRARLVVARAGALARQGRVAAADALVADARAALGDRRAGTAGRDEGDAELAAAAGLLALVGGDPAAAARAAAPVAASSALGAAVAAAGLALDGRARAALDLLPARSAGGLLTGLLADGARLVSLWLSGRVDELERWTARRHAEVLAGPASAADAHAALLRGAAALAAGRPRTAARWLTEACAGLAVRDPVGVRPVGLAGLAVARAQIGDARAARETVTAAAGRPPRPAGGADAAPFAAGGPCVDLAEVWMAAAEGRVAQAADRAVATAARARELGQPVVEALAWHDATRLGAAERARDRLAELAAATHAPLIDVLAAHARAAAAGSGPQLRAAATRLAAAGLALAAAEAWAAAARAYRGEGRRRESAACAARANEVVAACEGPATPGLDALDAPQLTAREDEVARLAVAGLDNHAIARRLVLSVRTVEAHLANGYAKLGVEGRSGLGEVLAPPVPAQRRGVDGG